MVPYMSWLEASKKMKEINEVAKGVFMEESKMNDPIEFKKWFDDWYGRVLLDESHPTLYEAMLDAWLASKKNKDECHTESVTKST